MISQEKPPRAGGARRLGRPSSPVPSLLPVTLFLGDREALNREGLCAVDPFWCSLVRERLGCAPRGGQAQPQARGAKGKLFTEDPNPPPPGWDVGRPACVHGRLPAGVCRAQREFGGGRGASSEGERRAARSKDPAMMPARRPRPRPSTVSPCGFRP